MPHHDGLCIQLSPMLQQELCTVHVPLVGCTVEGCPSLHHARGYQVMSWLSACLQSDVNCCIVGMFSDGTTCWEPKATVWS